MHGDAREVDMTGADVIWLNDAVRSHGHLSDLSRIGHSATSAYKTQLDISTIGLVDRHSLGSLRKDGTGSPTRDVGGRLSRLSRERHS